MTFRDILLMAEFFVLLQFINPLPDLNFGNISGIAVTAAAMLMTVYHERYPVLTAAYCCLLIIIIIVGAVLSRKMFNAAANKPPENQPVTLIVLGCRVKGERPTRMLRRRLDAAKEFLDSDSQAVCIVSGGKGNDECISEAQAMKTYLTAHGIEAERVIMEDCSRTTEQNLSFSKKIILERSLPQTTALATDGFHQYRAAVFARRIGLEPYAVSAATEPRYLLTYLVREWIAILALSLPLRVKNK